MSYIDAMRISALPGLDTLARWRRAGVGCLLNVSGVDIGELHQAQATAGFAVAQTRLVDIFANSPLATGHGADDGRLYQQLADEGQRLALIRAVTTLLGWLRAGRSVAVFCHLGQSRSPLVASAALRQLQRCSPGEAIAQLRARHPQARFTEVGWSALHWCRHALKDG